MIHYLNAYLINKLVELYLNLQVISFRASSYLALATTVGGGEGVFSTTTNLLVKYILLVVDLSNAVETFEISRDCQQKDFLKIYKIVGAR